MDNTLLSIGTHDSANVGSKIVSTVFTGLKAVLKMIINVIMCLLVLLTFLFLVVFTDNKINQIRKTNLPPLVNTYVIVSPSMVPTIKVQDAVIVTRTKANALKVGDIITFKSSDPRYEGYTITHRINEIVKADNGQIMFRTKGDNNDSTDNSLVPASNVYGKVMVKLPYLGVLQNILISPIAIFFIFVLPCALFVIYNLMKRLKHKKKDLVNSDSDIVVEIIEEENYNKNRIFVNENGSDIEIQIV